MGGGGRGVACCPAVVRPGLRHAHVWSEEAGEGPERAAETARRANTGLRGRGKGRPCGLGRGGEGREDSGLTSVLSPVVP